MIFARVEQLRLRTNVNGLDLGQSLVQYIVLRDSEFCLLSFAFSLEIFVHHHSGSPRVDQKPSRGFSILDVFQHQPDKMDASRRP